MGVDLRRRSCGVASAVRPVLGGWQLDTDTGPIETRHLVMTVPVPQAAALLGAEHSFHPRIADVVMAPCLTLMAAFPADVPRPFRSRTADDHPLAWISEDSSKPGRTSGLTTWVAQASAEWSAQRLEDTVEVVKRRPHSLVHLVAQAGKALEDRGEGDCLGLLVAVAWT